MASRAPLPPPLPPPALPTDVVARRFSLPLADLACASPQAVVLVPEKWARRFHIVPLSASERELLVATANPLDVDCERTLGFATGRHVRFAVADPDAISERIDELYRGLTPSADPESITEVQHLANTEETAPPAPD